MTNTTIKNWWFLLLKGVLTVLIGLLALFKPEDLIKAISLYLGIIIAASGIFVFLNSFLSKVKSPSSRWWTGAGMVLLFTGLVLIFFPNIVIGLFVFILSFWIILMGVIQIQSAIDVKEVYRYWSLILAGGIVSVVLGIVFLFNPFSTANTLISIAGIYAIILGIIMSINSFQVRNLTIP